MKVFIPTTYTFRPALAEGATALEQPSATLAEAPAQEAPIDLDTALSRLDAEFKTLDELVAKEQKFPSTIADIEAKLTELESQDLDTISALEARQSQQGKLSNMKSLVIGQVKKNKAAIAAQTEVVVKIGTQANSLAQQLWSSLEREAYDQAKAKLSELFFRPYEHQDILERYKPLALLSWLKVPDLFVSSPDIKITRFRALRAASEKLKEFAEMTFAQVSERLEEIDRHSREQAQERRKIGSEPVS
jgi:hypothetical protein